MEKIKLSDDILKDINRRYQNAYNSNQRFIRLLIEATHLCAPMSDGLNVLYSFDDSGIDINRNISNATPKLASNLRANQLHSLLCPINKHWGKVVSIDPVTHEKVSNDSEAQAATNYIFNEIDNSNIHDVLKSFFVDLNIGCAALWVETGKNKPITFIPIAGITLMPEINNYNNRSNCFWRRVVEKSEMDATYPGHGRTPSASEGKSDLFYIDYAHLKISEDSEEYYYIETTEGKFENPLRQKKVFSNHLILVNDMLRPGEGRGRGTIMNNIEDIRYLNDISHSLRNYLEYSSDPAFLGNSKIKTSLMQLRGKIISSGLSQGHEPIFKPINWEIPVQAVDQIIQYLEAKIRTAFNVMTFGEVSETPVRTATEVAARRAEAERQSIADLSRIAGQLLNKTMNAVYRKGVEYDNMPKLKNHGFLFDSLQETLQNAEQLNSLLQYSELSQEVNSKVALQTFNNQQKIDSLLKNLLDIPDSIQNTPQEVQAFIKAQQNAQNQQQGGQSQQGQLNPQSAPVQALPGEPLSPPQIGVPQTLGR